jgi:hypothetical protein
MPYPQNFKTAQQVEDVVRAGGATPATIAILNGRVCIGLNAEQLELLAKTGHNARKTSRRDIAYVLSSNLIGNETSLSVCCFVFLKSSVMSLCRQSQFICQVQQLLVEQCCWHIELELQFLLPVALVACIEERRQRLTFRLI